MSYMLSGCSSLISLNLTNFNTSSVTDMSYMFNLLSQDVMNLYETPLENVNEMIDKSYYINSLDLSNFNTTSVINMSYMLSGFISLKSLNLTKFNTSSVINMEGMFYECI